MDGAESLVQMFCCYGVIVLLQKRIMSSSDFLEDWGHSREGGKEK